MMGPPINPHHLKSFEILQVALFWEVVLSSVQMRQNYYLARSTGHMWIMKDQLKCMVHFEDKGMFPKVHWWIQEDSGISRGLGLNDSQKLKTYMKKFKINKQYKVTNFLQEDMFNLQPTYGVLKMPNVRRVVLSRLAVALCRRIVPLCHAIALCHRPSRRLFFIWCRQWLCVPSSVALCRCNSCCDRQRHDKRRHDAAGDGTTRRTHNHYLNQLKNRRRDGQRHGTTRRSFAVFTDKAISKIVHCNFFLTNHFLQQICLTWFSQGITQTYNKSNM